MTGRAVTAALGLLVACSGIAMADSVGADADTVTAGNQTVVSLGTVGAGSTRSVDVGFELACLGTSHADPGTTLTLTPTTTPAAGGAMSASSTTIGPVPATWPVDGDPCVNDEVFAGTAVSHVSITAPAAAGSYLYKVTYAKSPSGGVSGSTIAQFTLSVAANSAPVLDLPTAMTVEGDTLGGWTAVFAASATDAEDDPEPVVACLPAPGAVLPLGMTTVDCAATDTAGSTTTGSFAVTVVDTAAPVVAGMGDLAASTANPSGAAVAYATPGATDVVDGPVDATCDHPSGSTFPVGTTVVTCAAADVSGNTGSTQFSVTVELVPAPQALVAWLPPAADGMTVQPGRTLPLKVSITVGGLVQTGAGGIVPALRLERVGGAPAETRDAGPFAWDDGAWKSNVDTSTLAGGTWRAVVVVGGDALGSLTFTVAPRGNDGGEGRGAVTRGAVHEGRGARDRDRRDDRTNDGGIRGCALRAR